MSANPEDDLEALSSTVEALQAKLEARRAAVLEEAAADEDGPSGKEEEERDRWHEEMLCRDDSECERLRGEKKKPRARLELLRFLRDNETSFAAETDGSKAVLGVTSGLTIPTTPLPTKSTEDKISQLIRQHYTGGVADRLIREEIDKRRKPLLKKAKIGRFGWACLPLLEKAKIKRSGWDFEQEEELRRTVEAEIRLPSRLGLVDAGGRSSHAAGERMLSDGHRHGFIAAVTAAFAHHYPLVLRPQHFWLLVTQAVATHVDLNAEAVRKSWVEHEGKKKLEVSCDEFRLGSANDWASVVSGRPDSFSAQIAANTVEGVAEALAPAFSDTSDTEDIAQKIVVMDICKNYFDYSCGTYCGFPQITLEGTVDDWTVLRDATERLLGRCEKGFAARWSKSLLPLLDKLLAARRGEEVDSLFWNSMCKRGGTVGSGARSWFNGWFNVFFPYINQRPNRFCEPYSNDRSYVMPVSNDMDAYTGMLSPGPDCVSFGSGMSQAPVNWEYFGETIPLEFNAGFTGAVQDAETLEITPQVGWFITHKAPESQESECW